MTITKCQIKEDFPNYRFTIEFTDSNGIPANKGDVQTLLSSMIPAHLQTTYQYDYTINNNQYVGTLLLQSFNVKINPVKFTMPNLNFGMFTSGMINNHKKSVINLNSFVMPNLSGGVQTAFSMSMGYKITIKMR
ncbi:hypothetical protein [Desulfosporosinus sp. FKA]|uniref:hypothetical protein n=1 Tax=Desulfosporosinus sp. FKA TaxID=1969834 RepID=UPI000B49EF88|nr:hypothetical protein [Desulfosporosinus sp. FKA]